MFGSACLPPDRHVDTPAGPDRARSNAISFPDDDGHVWLPPPPAKATWLLASEDDVGHDAVAPSRQAAETRPDELLSVVVGRDGWVGEQLTPTDRALERRRIDFPQLFSRIGDCRLRAADGDVGSDDTMVRDETSVVDVYVHVYIRRVICVPLTTEQRCFSC